MYIVRIFLMYILGILLVGCANSVSTLKPVVNNSTKSLDIMLSDNKTIHIQNAKMRKINKPIIDDYTLSSIKRKKYKITSNNSVCSKMYFYINDTSSSGKIYINSSLYERLKDKKNLTCVKENINDIQFIHCETEYKHYYYVTILSGIKHGGYVKEEWFYMKHDEDCFNKFKEFARDNRTYMKIPSENAEKSKLDETYQNKKYSTNTTSVEDQSKNDQIKIYKGTFVSTRASKCASIGKINIRTQKNSIGGNIIYKLKGKEYVSAFSGEIIENKFAAQTDNINILGEIHGKEIKGKYYSDECEGIFNAVLEQ